MTSLAAKILIAPIRFYQRFITPYTPASCRYYPTCSAYAVTALRTRGAIVGTGLTIWRLLRCNPWSDGGIDHVPAKGDPRRGEHQGPHDEHDPNHDHAEHDRLAENTSAADRGERDDTVGSFSTAGAAVNPAATDLDAPHSAAAEPMTGRSAA
jgi:hypothetical protein